MTPTDAARRLKLTKYHGGTLHECDVYPEDVEPGRGEDEDAVLEWALPLLDDREIDEAWLRSVGFKLYRGDVPAYTIGPSNATLFLVEGYNNSGYWAMVVKYPMAKCLEGYARSVAHFDKRLTTRGHVRQLAAALGIALRETPA